MLKRLWEDFLEHPREYWKYYTYGMALVAGYLLAMDGRLILALLLSFITTGGIYLDHRESLNKK